MGTVTKCLTSPAKRREGDRAPPGLGHEPTRGQAPRAWWRGQAANSALTALPRVQQMGLAPSTIGSSADGPPPATLWGR